MSDFPSWVLASLAFKLGVGVPVAATLAVDVLGVGVHSGVFGGTGVAVCKSFVIFDPLVRP